MPVFTNSLTREVSLKVGPVILDVLVKHYFDRLKSDNEANEAEGTLKKDDVLYHEAFTIVKSFLHASTFHTIEELQSFSNTRTPSSPWTHVVRVLVPLSCCEEAAPYLIKALGGEDVARRLVGGVKWWQVRGVNGVDAQWLTSKKDWQDSKRRYKKEQQEKKERDAIPPMKDANLEEKSEGVYEEKMDAMRCILYLHGGGYYFGSVDQERYSIQRFARKINGRVFAINYRLAPQYPFPCALHDALASYIYLIRPPQDSAHQAVDPGHIIVAGDSAGGGLSLALLQVIRDSGLPAPAGGVLISPWCDLTHSFPSILTNTHTDVVPESGMSFHKPSVLWPPPSQEISSRVHASLRFRIRQAFRSDDHDHPHPTHETTFSESRAPPDLANLNSTNLATPLMPNPPSLNPEKVACITNSGELIEVEEQLHFYAKNSLLNHPLVSPCMAYLGGLPPLFFFAGDQEVLRDEVIYTAHKAAYPTKYPISEHVKELYPALRGIEERFGPTSVHIQIYDESPHILPILFSFTNPAKFCFRAIANFCKVVTGMAPILPVPGATDELNLISSSTDTRRGLSRRQSLFANFQLSSGRDKEKERERAINGISKKSSSSASVPSSPAASGFLLGESSTELKEHVPLVSTGNNASNRGDIRYMEGFPGAGGVLRRHTSMMPSIPAVSGSPESMSTVPASLETRLSDSLSDVVDKVEEVDVISPISILSSTSVVGPPQSTAVPCNGKGTTNSPARQQQNVAGSTASDVGGPRFNAAPPLVVPEPAEVKMAGNMFVYSGIKDIHAWDCRMIRERVATTGIVRPLECESELDALQVPAERIGVFSEGTMRRYLRERAIFDKKFAHTVKSIEKNRRNNIERAKQETIRRLSIFKQTLQRKAPAASSSSTDPHHYNHKGARVRENVISSPDWGWAWALDEAEDPPPSSIVSRRDTEEARKLAEIADQAVLSDDQTFSANNLWSVIINFLTVTPGKPKQTLGSLRMHLSGSSEGVQSANASVSAIASEAGSSEAARPPSIERINSMRKPEKRLKSKLSSLWKRHGHSRERHEEYSQE